MTSITRLALVSIAALGLTSGLAGCAATVPPTILAAAPSDATSWVPAQRAYLAWNLTNRGWNVTPSGLQYKRVGRAFPKAPQPTGTDNVSVHYRGTLINGTEFDSSYSRNEPASFPLNRVIKGWTEGVALMHVGETYDFVIPANLAYAGRRMGDDIPAESTLLFRVQLLAVNP
jgi:FKBP-type peptidyl-prolyl cis-trans isomerase FkpA